VSEGSTEGGLSHVGHVILFKNQGPRSCLISGYPGVALLDSDGAQVSQVPRSPSGYLGGLSSGNADPPVIDLGTGQTASSMMEGSDQSASGAACPGYSQILVTPPGQRQSLVVRGEWGGCGLTVHPVVDSHDGRDPGSG